MAECQVVKHPEGFDILHLPLGQQILAFHISTGQNFNPFTEAEFSKKDTKSSSMTKLTAFPY